MINKICAACKNVIKNNKIHIHRTVFKLTKIHVVSGALMPIHIHILTPFILIKQNNNTNRSKPNQTVPFFFSLLSQNFSIILILFVNVSDAIFIQSSFSILTQSETNSNFHMLLIIVCRLLILIDINFVKISFYSILAHTHTCIRPVCLSLSPSRFLSPINKSFILLF